MAKLIDLLPELAANKKLKNSGFEDQFFIFCLPLDNDIYYVKKDWDKSQLFNIRLTDLIRNDWEVME